MTPGSAKPVVPKRDDHVAVHRFGWTGRADGDHAVGDGAPRVPGAPAPATWLEQVHGPDVVVVTRPGEHAGTTADAAVTATAGCSVLVRTADCAPVVLLAPGAVGVVHAGWRGLVAGVVQRAAAAMADLGHPARTAHLGPCIRPGCYEFAGPELDEVVARYGEGVRASTGWGTDALDLPAAVGAACAEAGVVEVVDVSGCTACDRRWFSHRARAETERQATVAWLA
jgi:polyphenol oxidase